MIGVSKVTAHSPREQEDLNKEWFAKASVPKRAALWELFKAMVLTESYWRQPENIQRELETCPDPEDDVLREDDEANEDLTDFMMGGDAEQRQKDLKIIEFRDRV